MKQYCTESVEYNQYFDCLYSKVGFLLDTNRQSHNWPTNTEIEEVINEVFIPAHLHHVNITFVLIIIIDRNYIIYIMILFNILSTPQVKDYGMAGISLYHINMENNEMHGHFARMLAELLYL